MSSSLPTEKNVSVEFWLLNSVAIQWVERVIFEMRTSSIVPFHTSAIAYLTPKYKSLPPLAKFADNVVRTYKTFGEKEALAEIKKRPDDPKVKSISYAFLLVFGKAKDKKWQYSQVEIEYGDFLKDHAKKLLDSEPKKYHKALKELLSASGSSENIDNYLI